LILAMGRSAAMLPVALWALRSLATPPARPEGKKNAPQLCDSMPYLDFKEALWSNLGGLGPDRGAEGMTWRVQANRHTGLPWAFENRSLHDLQLHVHAIGPYKNSCPKCNGFKNGLGSVVVDSGTNVSLLMHFYDTVKKENVTLPKGSLSFVDFDKEATSKAIEFVTVHDSFSHTYTANGTTLFFEKDLRKKTTTFWASVQGVGADNPTSLGIMTPTQKRKGLTLQFGGSQSFEVTVGSVNSGSYPREVLFAFHPGIVCALTRLPNGVVVPATDSTVRGNPMPVLEFGGRTTAYDTAII